MNQSPTIQRAAVMDALRALAVAHRVTANHLNQGEFSAGYNEGFTVALIAAASVIGAQEEMVKLLMDECNVQR